MSDKESTMDDTLTPEQLEEGRRRFANIGQPLGAVLFDYWLWKNFSALLTTAERAVAERDALRAEVERLREALKPFAAAPAHGLCGGPLVQACLIYEDGTDEDLARHRGRIPAEAFIRARAALNGGNADG